MKEAKAAQMNQTKGLRTFSKCSVKSVGVRTEQFEFAHRRKPRGQGHWMFGMGNVTYQEVGFTGSYTEAKSKAKKFAAARGHYTVTVLP